MMTALKPFAVAIAAIAVVAGCSAGSLEAEHDTDQLNISERDGEDTGSSQNDGHGSDTSVSDVEAQPGDTGALDTGTAPRDAEAMDTGTEQDTGGETEQDTGGETQDSGTEQDTGQQPECELPPQSSLAAPLASASWRFGGGTNYPNAIEADPDCMNIVETAGELVAALDSASAGDVIYVDDDARIDLTGDGGHCIPEGVWLVGGRGVGHAPGGVIYADDALRPMLRVCGDGVRISGLRIIGNDPDECPPQWPDNCPQEDNTGGVNCRDCTSPSIAIRSDGNDDLELDNNELAGWAHAALYITDGVDLHVHHNYIHHTWRQGLGYGVVLMRGGSDVVDTVVEWNRFNHNRHAIAGSGEPGQSYVARHNFVDHHANGHVFDMHGYDENTGTGSDIAGTDIRIHDNTVLVDDYYTKVIRGVPENGSWLYDNCLARTSSSSAANQTNFSGNFYVDQNPSGDPAPNQYGQGPGDCESQRWCYAPGATGGWTYGAVSGVSVDSLALGDFNGDGKADVLRTANGEWNVVYGATGSWQYLNTSIHTLESLALGDFNGDGKTDTFNANGSQWRVSWGGTSSWDTLRNTTETLDELGFGDFNGDGQTDVLTSDGSRWLVSWGGSSPWETLNNSSIGVDQLGFGDFNGDGKTDLFRPTGSEWDISWGGTSSWETVNSSGIGLDGLRFGDFNGDGRTDVLRTRNNEWFVSWAATTSWELLRVSSLSGDDILLGDITGDGRTDVFATGCH